MKRIILTVALVVAVAVCGVLVYAVTLPDSFRVTRSATIDAPPEAVYPLIADFRNWTRWSPWEHRDPQLERTYSGAPSGKGAVYQWVGKSDVGEGRMEITETSEPSNVRLSLDFVRPFEAHNTVEFGLVPDGEATRVTWSMDGHTPYLAKVIHVFVDMDAMVGTDFEKGLAAMKDAVRQ